MGRLERFRHGILDRHRIGCAMGLYGWLHGMVLRKWGVKTLPCAAIGRRSAALQWRIRELETMPMLPTPVVAVVLAPLVLWRLYSRIKRLTTRQRSRTWRHRTTLVFFPLLVLLLAVGTMGAPAALGALAAGIALGVPLGLAATSKTLFEQAGDEFYFTPHAPIGFAVASLFICRMGYRAWEFYAQGSAVQHDLVRSPLTLLVFGILAGYYMTYAIGLLRWRQRTAAN
jgi:hypothetical protein